MQNQWTDFLNDYEFVAVTYNQLDNTPEYEPITIKYGRMTATFKRFHFKDRTACWVKCTIRKKVSKKT